MRGRGDLIDRQIELLEFRPHEIGELLGVGHVDLVEDDHARAFGNRNRAERQIEVVRVFAELLFERVVVRERVAIRIDRHAVDHMRNDLGAFDMPQKRQSQALALRGSRNEPGNVGDGVAHVAGLHDAQIRHERGERVVRDLRLGRAHRSDQRRLARRGKAHERDVCDRLELENDVAFVARFAEQRKPGCTACPVRQRRVAQAARATRRRDVRVTGMTQIGKHRTRLLGETLRAARLEHHSAHGNRQHEIRTIRAVFRVPQTHGAGIRRAMRHEAEVEQRRGILIGFEDHRTTLAAIAAVRPRQRLVFLAADAGRPIAAVAAFHMYGHSIHKITHNASFYRCVSIAALFYRFRRRTISIPRARSADSRVRIRRPRRKHESPRHNGRRLSKCAVRECVTR